MDEHPVAVAVARNVRAARAARGWSLDSLAARSGVSKGVLVSLEQARSNPNLATLVRIGDALGLPLTTLVEAATEPGVRLAVPTPLWHGPDGGEGVLLTGSDQPSAVELWSWRLAPGEELGSEPHAVGTRELIHVLEGVLTLVSDGVTLEVPAGGAARLVGDRPHRYANRGAAPVRYVAAVTVPPATAS